MAATRRWTGSVSTSGRGDIYGLIGRNGAGKTTLLKLLSGLAAPTAGDFTLFGATGRHARAYLSRVGTLIEAPGIYPNLSAAENLKLKCLTLGVRRRNAVSDLLDTVGLGSTGRKPVRHFSLGMKQRLGIALALVGDPDLLILDEPINGLDPQGIAEVRETLYHLNRDRNITLILASHILEELAKIATHYGILHDGALLQELTRQELLEKVRRAHRAPDQRHPPGLHRAGGLGHHPVQSGGPGHHLHL